MMKIMKPIKDYMLKYNKLKKDMIRTSRRHKWQKVVIGIISTGIGYGIGRATS